MASDVNTSVAVSPEPKTFRRIAACLTSRGIPVIPVQPREKRCIHTGWQNLATTDPAQIEEWNNENPNYNVGVVAKPDGVWILDGDQEGLDVIIERETKRKFPYTLKVKTSKGNHWYFKQTDASREMGNVKVGGKFDAQQNNKYVVGPGSIHPSGITYTVVDNTDIVPAPDWLVEWVAKHKTTHKVTKATDLKDVDGGSDLKTKLKWMVRYLKDNEVEVRSQPIPCDLGYKIHVTCPNVDEHSGDSGKTESTIIVLEKGGYDFECMHGHCDGIGWDEFREMTEQEIDFDDPKFQVEFVSPDEDTDDPEVAERDEDEIPPVIVGTINLTQSGNAKRLVQAQGQNLKYCHSKKKWYVWSGKRWLEDDRGVVFRWAERVVQTALAKEAKIAADGCDDEEKREELVDMYKKFALASESRNNLEAMITLAKNQQGTHIEGNYDEVL